ncbi:aspartate carbamoyltransferase [Candidatus Vecturithrix granuli]|uniref:Aspartate carbamoyltransferase n=1 Tax=Vecturithrix granuli TaxID=1499967 RepID=A0A081BZ21_VECG1|nr:aspartate carbamoyltransferase [Candidatus Vecturithrix granuli]
MSLLRINQLSKADMTALFAQAHEIEQGNYNREALRGKILIPMFFEPSTRTRLSFETAILRLGGQALPVPETNGLAISKGESLQDTIKVVSSFGDIIVMRHPTETALDLAAECATVPIINGGNGCDEHPTQTLLDLYTIQKEKGRIEGLHIGLIGDLKHARVMHSLAKGLAFYDVRLSLVSPPELSLPDDVRDVLRQRGSMFEETADLQSILGELDVIYMVMLQHHRISDPQTVQRLQQEYYCITPELLQTAKPDVIVLHPLVRRDEVSPEVDVLPNAAYFRQARNGVFVRMALLEQMLNHDFPGQKEKNRVF